MSEKTYKPQMPDLMEAVFDAAYLIFDGRLEEKGFWKIDVIFREKDCSCLYLFNNIVCFFNSDSTELLYCDVSYGDIIVFFIFDKCY